MASHMNKDYSPPFWQLAPLTDKDGVPLRCMHSNCRRYAVRIVSYEVPNHKQFKGQTHNCCSVHSRPTKKERESMMRQLWRIVDTRIDEPCSVVSYLTKEQAEAQVEYYRRRDAVGGRPDIHDLIPHLGVREHRPTDKW